MASITNGGVTTSYIYYANGNIDTINGDEIKYRYDELNELVREDNKILNKTITYSYDAGGNITAKTEYPYTTDEPGTATATYNYTYGDSNWKDKLTNYNGQDITYDSIGNPLTYNGWAYTWEKGRQLKSMSGNGHSISYKYNDSGIRTQKTVDGVTTNYRLVGDKVTYEDNGTDKIYYSYDASGNIVSMNLNGVEYYYIRNAQGDITGLFDGSGSQVVSYVYDSWGKLISIDGSLKDSVEVKNPYRYRGYRYDAETELYYLNSHYYNPQFGRFINADGIIGQTGELLGHNLFIYSKNNSVNMSDSDGFRPEFSGAGHDTGDNSADGFAIMNKRYDYSTGYINKKFDYEDSVNKGMKSRVIDKVGEVISGAIVFGAILILIAMKYYMAAILSVIGSIPLIVSGIGLYLNNMDMVGLGILLIFIIYPITVKVIKNKINI